jgi:hypothetical protein
MYHSYRALSLQQNGFLSWDNIWDNGISYWRGYQLFGALSAAMLATLFSVSITKAMLILTFLCFICINVANYIAARAFRLSPLVSFSVVGILLGLTHFWFVVGFYSTMFAATILPAYLALWKLTSYKKQFRPIFAFALAIGIYIHPLLTISLFGLWLISIYLEKLPLFSKKVLLEFSIIIMVTFFYWYTLFFISYGSPDPYQLSRDFLYIVAGVFNFSGIFYLIGIGVLITAILRPRTFSPYSQYAFWYVLAIYVIDYLTINTDKFEFLNKFQLYRLGFFIVPLVVILFGEFLQSIYKKIPYKLYASLAIMIFALGSTQSLINSYVYGFTTVDVKQSPVTSFFADRERPNGTIYLADSTTASYQNPDLRFSNGYNDQLLPQQLNVRLSKLLSSTAPNFSVNSKDMITAENYMKLLNIEYVFLPEKSPYVTPLQTQLGFDLVNDTEVGKFNHVVLTPPWKSTYAAIVSCSRTSQIVNPKYPSLIETADMEDLDAKILTAASLLYDNDSKIIPITFPTKDKIAFSVPTSKNEQCILVNQSYATNWKSQNASVSPTSYGMILAKLEPTAGKTVVELKNSWGYTIHIQMLLLVIATANTYYLFKIYRRKPNDK